MTTTTVDVVEEGLIRRLRATVASELSSRASDTQRSSGRRLDADDQAALARRLIDEELERHARDCLSSNQPVLTETQEHTVSRAVFDRIFQLGRLQPLIDDEQVMN